MSTQISKPIIECRNVVKTFHKKDAKNKLRFNAVDDVSFTLGEGETLALIGESGSGKSTLAKMIMGLDSYDSGSIVVNQKEVKNLRGKAKRLFFSDIQMIFQNPNSSFDPKKTLGYGIGESLKNRGLSEKDVRNHVNEYLVLCGLDESFYDKYPHEVSGGECQRAAIARSLVVEPKILVCDEATSSLDVTIQKQIMELLSDLKTKKCLSVLFICHNMALVQQFSDRVIVLKDGKIIEQGETEQVIEKMGEYFG